MAETDNGGLDGRRALITGGGRGIGAAVAAALVEAGAEVVVSARTLKEIEAVAAALGERASAVTCDVAEPEQIARLAAAAMERMGGVDILVNNAGIARSAPLKALTLEEWNRIMAVNATGVFLCTQAVLPQMVERGWGRVINVASIAGKMGAPYIAAYSASKHAVIGFTRSVAMEVATSGVTVNAVCPGYVNTPMTEASVHNIVAKTGRDADTVMKNLRAASPQRRLMESEEVAYLVVSLCDERARGVTAQALVLDGGGVQS